MKFLADQNLSRKVVDKLCEAGLDVARVADVLNPRATDAEILVEAERRGAIILSHDQDFSTLLAASGMTRPSLVNLRVSYVEVDVDPRGLACEAGAVRDINADRGSDKDVRPLGIDRDGGAPSAGVEEGGGYVQW